MSLANCTPTTDVQIVIVGKDASGNVVPSADLGASEWSIDPATGATFEKESETAVWLINGKDDNGDVIFFTDALVTVVFPDVDPGPGEAPLTIQFPVSCLHDLASTLEATTGATRPTVNP